MLTFWRGGMQIPMMTAIGNHDVEQQDVLSKFLVSYRARFKVIGAFTCHPPDSGVPPARAGRCLTPCWWDGSTTAGAQNAHAASTSTR